MNGEDRWFWLDEKTRRAIYDCWQNPAKKPLKVGPLPCKGVPAGESTWRNKGDE